MSVETQVTKEDLLAGLTGKLVVYSDLTQCFYYPAEPTMALLQGEMETHIPFYELLDLDPKPHFDTIKRWMKSYKKEGDICLELQKEYTRLFINSKPKVPAPPYGSLYLENKGMIWGETTTEAVKLYVEAGLKVAEDFKDIPDHFAAELEFMWYLMREEVKARGFFQENTLDEDAERVKKVTDLQTRFLNNHLGVWYERFLDRVIASSRMVFYREVSTLAKKYITFEIQNRVKSCRTIEV
jgi:TorA maturation chaperone TorD